jgi:hypothetical protein
MQPEPYKDEDREVRGLKGVFLCLFMSGVWVVHVITSCVMLSICEHLITALCGLRAEALCCW